MSDLGALLRKAREQRGYTLDDIQEYTKIRKRYLEAIEAGEYKVLPGSFYVRAFVKTYAETVGLDAEEVLRLYHKELPKSAIEEQIAVEPRMKPGRRVQHNDRWGKVAVTLLMWAFPILIAAVIYVYVTSKDANEPDELNQSQQITTETGTPSPSPSITNTPSETPIETPSPSPTLAMNLKETTPRGTKHFEITSGTGHKLTIEITGACWVGVYHGTSDKGTSLLNKSFTAANTPTTVTFDLTEQTYVTVGRADNTIIKIDDQVMDDGDKPGASRFIFTPIATVAQ
ncbi:MAG: helix-turn-helix domain-containing protein [Candidatus Cohnella colombiensis]|uniref:Helix-turn-helix domain-containing protein n=1 Tax=Candidatus Cohnella colombiensis TaxID=3121368 RepID=A0AA95JH67_9BACL|nr:MAG: helix-turn-helix domain-containing protein [Cohnella sp.]